eukprot:480469-Prymnesium_polylepis.1
MAHTTSLPKGVTRNGSGFLAQVSIAGVHVRGKTRQTIEEAIEDVEEMRKRQRMAQEQRAIARLAGLPSLRQLPTGVVKQSRGRFVSRNHVNGK